MTQRYFELRNVADHGGMAHVSPEETERAIQAAADFLAAIESLLK